MTDRRSRFRRPPSLHRPPAPPAPVTPDEVLERGPLAPYVAGGQVPDVSRETVLEGLDDPEAFPPLRRDQVVRLEALTAVWAREVRDQGGYLPGPDDTLLYASAAKPPPPPSSRPRLELVAAADEGMVMPGLVDQVKRAADEAARLEVESPPPPTPDEDEVLERSRQLLEEEAAREASRTPAPVPPRGPGRDQEPGSALTPTLTEARVSDWVSRHDPRSLEYPVRSRLARAVPLADVSLETGVILDQGTTPPLTIREAAACVGMASAAAANVLTLRRLGHLGAAGQLLLEGDARRLYARAQELDHVHGEEYAGTSVLAGMKAGQELGLWGGYLWALGGTKDVAQVLLQLRVAVVVGVPWSTSLEEPDRHGIIRPGGMANGGHALAVVGLRLGLLGGSAGPWFELQQSRGRSEGMSGRVYVHHSHLARLLAGRGEAAVPLPAELLG